MTPETPRPTRLAGPLRLFAAVLIAGGVLLAAAPPAHAASGSYIRLAHLSPDTPKVDVYVTSLQGFKLVLRGVGYGAVSPYQRLAPGTYVVGMRTAGAAESTPPVLSASVNATTGSAYTVAGVGRYADLGLRVLQDDLTLPPQGQARVRVVQASAKVPNLDVRTAGGPVIAQGAAFATTTPYAVVPAGRWTLQVGATGDASPTTASVDLAPGAVYSVIVLDGPDGALQLVPRTDATGAGVVPAQGVAAGAGGTATEFRTDPARPVGAGVAGALVLLLAGVVLWLRSTSLSPLGSGRRAGRRRGRHAAHQH